MVFLPYQGVSNRNRGVRYISSPFLISVYGSRIVDCDQEVYFCESSRGVVSPFKWFLSFPSVGL